MPLTENLLFHHILKRAQLYLYKEKNYNLLIQQNQINYYT